MTLGRAGTVGVTPDGRGTWAVGPVCLSSRTMLVAKPQLEITTTIGLRTSKDSYGPA
jgi:hypothetical protein